MGVDLFKGILQKLSSEELQSEEIKENIKHLKELYMERGFRHEHSTIATFIVDYSGKSEEISMILAQNFRKIKEEIEEECKKSTQVDDRNEKFKEKIQRLSDHINLECIHLNILEKEVQRTEKNLKSLESQQKQYVVILGIFASIVLAFVSGLTFSTAVLSHMHEVSIYRLVFVICCIAFLIFNILFALFNFILKVLDKKSNLWILAVVDSCIVVAIMATCFVYLSQ